MQIVIEIDDARFKDIRRIACVQLENYHFKTVEQIIANGTPLPKGHGRLIDADAFERRCMFDSDIEDMQDVIYALHDYKSIIEADSEDEE